MKQGKQDDGFRMSDALWEQMEAFLPAPKPHPLGCHRPRVSNLPAMDTILLVLRTGMPWNALDGIRSFLLGLRARKHRAP